jgi:hypothetical protein
MPTQRSRSLAISMMAGTNITLPPFLSLFCFCSQTAEWVQALWGQSTGQEQAPDWHAIRKRKEERAGNYGRWGVVWEQRHLWRRFVAIFFSHNSHEVKKGLLKGFRITCTKSGKPCSAGHVQLAYLHVTCALTTRSSPVHYSIATPLTILLFLFCSQERPMSWGIKERPKQSMDGRWW